MMGVIEIVLIVLFGLLFIASSAAEKVFRVKAKKTAGEAHDSGEAQDSGKAQDSGEAPGSGEAPPDESCRKFRSLRTVFSLLAGAFAAGVFIVLLIAGASHTVLLAAVLIMFFLMIV